MQLEHWLIDRNIPFQSRFLGRQKACRRKFGCVHSKQRVVETCHPSHLNVVCLLASIDRNRVLQVSDAKRPMSMISTC